MRTSIFLNAVFSYYLHIAPTQETLRLKVAVSVEEIINFRFPQVSIYSSKNVHISLKLLLCRPLSGWKSLSG